MWTFKCFLLAILGIFLISGSGSVEVNCGSELRMGQYLCIEAHHIDKKTQQIKGCTKDNVATSEFPEVFSG